MSDEEVFTLEPRDEKKNNSGGEFALIPAGTVLRAQVNKVSKDTKPWKNKTTGEAIVKVSFEFQVIEEGEFENRRVWGETWPEFTDDAGCVLRAWVQEILGVDTLEPGFSFRPSDLVGLTTRIDVGIDSWTGKDGESRSKNDILDVMRDKEGVSVGSSSYDQDYFGGSESEPF